MSKKTIFCLGILIFAILVSCEPAINPCNCAQNLLKNENGFNQELDDACDKFLENLNEKDAKKWTDSMMNCVSALK